MTLACPMCPAVYEQGADRANRNTRFADHLFHVHALRFDEIQQEIERAENSSAGVAALFAKLDILEEAAQATCSCCLADQPLMVGHYHVGEGLVSHADFACDGCVIRLIQMRLAGWEV